MHTDAGRACVAVSGAGGGTRRRIEVRASHPHTSTALECVLHHVHITALITSRGPCGPSSMRGPSDVCVGVSVCWRRATSAANIHARSRIRPKSAYYRRRGADVADVVLAGAAVRTTQWCHGHGGGGRVHHTAVTVRLPPAPAALPAPHSGT